MKVLLITPPFYRILGFYNRYFPFGITLLGTVLKEAGEDVVVYDADYCADSKSIDYSQMSTQYYSYLKSFSDKNNPIWKEVMVTIKKHNPDVVGISAYTPFVASAFYLAKLIKKMKPSCVVVMGGPHATVCYDEILRVCPSVDYVVRGEAEESLPELVSFLKNGKPSKKNILGLSYRKGEKIEHNRGRPMARDIDKYPIPDRELLVNRKELSSEDMGLIMTSRGCPYHCTYCASVKGLTYRSVGKVLDEIKLVNEKYGTRQFVFKDDSFTVNRDRVIDLCKKMIKMNLKVNWECNTRVNLVDEKLLMLMKKAGCNFVKVGVETGSKKILKWMNKGITMTQTRVAAKLFRKVGIHWTGYFMMGVLGETVGDVYKTVDYIKELKPNLAIMAVYEPFPGTEMFRQGVQKGLLKENMSLADFFEIFPSDYYKVNAKIQNDMISPARFDKLETEVNDIVRRYNMRLGNVMRMMVSKLGVYTHEPKIFLEDINKFFKYFNGKLKDKENE